MGVKKVGILTFHRAHNYGAVLQAYAMQTFLEQSGFQSYLIDYRNHYLEEQYKLFSWKFYIRVGLKAPVHFVNRLLTFGNRIHRRKNFIDFNKNFIKEDFCDNYDAIVFGSDQIWNPSVTGGFDDYYWGGILPDKKITRIAYAPSLEAGNIEKYNNQVSKALKRFTALSVREADLQSLLKKYTDKEVRLVCDPTFLIPDTCYEKILKPLQVKKDFLVIYQVNRNDLTYKVADYLANKYDLQIVEFGQNTSIINWHRYQNTAGPGEFVWAIKNAKYVVTSSFHGTAFSIILKKQFFVTTAGIKEKRMRNLLYIANLEERLVPDVEHVKMLGNIDYTNQLGDLANYIKLSQDYLLKNLNSHV